MQTVFRFQLIVVLISISLLMAACQTSTLDNVSLAKEYYNIATAYAELKQVEKARVFFLRALELDPSFSGANFNFARALIDQGKYADAITVLKSLEQGDPSNTLIIESIAFCNAKQGFVVDAEQAYRRVLALSGEKVSVLLNLARLCRKDKPTDARDFLERARRAAPKSRSVLLEFAEFELEQKRDAEAYVLFMDYRLVPADKNQAEKPEVLKTIAALAERLAYYAKAIEVYNEIKTLQVQDSAAPFALCRLNYVAAKDYVLAVQFLEEALSKGFADWAELKKLYNAIDPELQGEFTGVARKYLEKFPVIPEAEKVNPQDSAKK